MYVYADASFDKIGKSVSFKNVDVLGVVDITNSGSAAISASFLSGLEISGVSGDVKVKDTNFQSFSSKITAVDGTTTI